MFYFIIIIIKINFICMFIVKEVLLNRVDGVDF